MVLGRTSLTVSMTHASSVLRFAVAVSGQPCLTKPYKVMKPNVKVCYLGSGVKFTKNLSNVFIVISLLFLIAGIVFIAVSDGYELFISLAVTSFIMFFVGLAISAALQALSSIAKTALYKRTLMEAKYSFEDVYSYNEVANDLTEG